MRAFTRISASLAFSFSLITFLTTSVFAQHPMPLDPGSIQVSRVQYDGNGGINDGYNDTFPYIFNDPNVTGIQGSVWIDQFTTVPFNSVQGTLSLPSSGSNGYITSSFSSKSEGALMLSPDAAYLTYMGYQGSDQLAGVSNSYSNYCPAQLYPVVAGPYYDREVALIGIEGLLSLTPEENAFSGDNPRAAITVDGYQFYMAGNSDSTEYTATTSKPICGDTSGTFGPGYTIGARYDGSATSGTPPDMSIQLGVYVATDRPDESAKQHVKDNNWRGIGIYPDAEGNLDLYVSKGSGGNGDDGVFWVQNGTGPGLPTGTGNTIVPLFSAPATNPTTQAASPYVPFGFWFANPTTLYVADEGYANTDSNGNLIPDPLAGLEKWTLVNGTWTLQYTIQAGLNLYVPQTIPNYPASTYPTGIRNMTGWVNGDGTATIYAITAQYSTFSTGEPDPTSLVGITDTIAATTLPTNEQFVTIQNSGSQEAYRGVAFIPPGPGFERATQTITFPSVGTQTYGVSPITLTATATSGWPIAYTVTSGPATVSGNVLTITGAGSVTLQANQSGNTSYSAAAAVSQTFTVNQEPQTITLSNVPASAAYGTSFTVSATGGSSGNSIVFTSAGSCSNMGASYTITSGSGTCSVIANQAGNVNYLAAPQVTASVGATPAATSISVTSVSPASETYAQDGLVTITAVLSWSGVGNAPTASDVTIGGNGPSAYGTTSCSAPSGTNLTCTNTYTPTLADGAGSYTESASFSGDGNYSNSASTATGNFSITQETTTTSVVCTPSTSAYGASVSCTATVNTLNGDVKAGKPSKVKSQQASGTVTWSGNTGCSSSTLSGDPGTATCSTSSLAVGSDSVTATYAGDTNHSGSSNSTSQTVTQAATSITVSSVSPASETFAQDAPVTITAVISWTGSGAAPTASNVSIGGNGPSSYGTTSCSAPSANTITCTNTYTPTLSDAVGSYTESATFSGDGNYTSSSTSPGSNFSITQESTTTSVACTPSTSAYGSSVTCTATVNTLNGDVKARKPSKVKSQQATGNITWSSNTGCSSSTLSGDPGTASCTTSSLAVGSDTVMATYSGDTNHSGGSGTFGQTVNKATTSISVTSVSPASETYLQDAKVTITAILSWSGSGSAPTASNVTIGGTGPSSYGVTSCSAPSGNTITCTNTYTPTAADGGGTYTESATFSGDGNYSNSSSTQSNNFTITPATQTITFTTNAPTSAVYNTSFTVAASASSGLAVTFTASGACTVSGAKYTMTSGSGSCLVYANQAGNNSYKAAPQVTQTVTAAPATQTITVTTPAPSSAVLGSTFTVAATASSGYTVAYGSSGGCTNSGATYTMAASGSTNCTVTFNQGGNNDYKAAPQITETVTPSPGTPPTVTFTGAPASAAYLSTFTVATTSGSDPSVPTITASGACTISGNNVTMTASTGTCTMTAFWAANSIYSAATLTQKTTGTKANPIITWPSPAAITYGTPLSATQLDASANLSGGTYTYTPVSGKILAAGTQTLSVKYTPADTTDYNTVTQTTTLVVNLANTTTTITSVSNSNPNEGTKVTVDFSVSNGSSSNPTGRVTVSDGDGDGCSGTLESGAGTCSITLKTAGSITLTASYPGDANNNPSSGTYAITVNP